LIILASEGPHFRVKWVLELPFPYEIGIATAISAVIVGFCNVPLVVFDALDHIPHLSIINILNGRRWF